MKGEVYGKRELSPLVGMSLMQPKVKTINAGGRARRRNNKRIGMLQPKRTKYTKMQKGRMKGLRNVDIDCPMECLVSKHLDSSLSRHAKLRLHVLLLHVT
jgi:hypothetical protein